MTVRMTMETAERLRAMIRDEGKLLRGPVELVEGPDGSPVGVGPSGETVALGSVHLTAAGWKTLAWNLIAAAGKADLFDWQQEDGWEAVTRELIDKGAV